MCTDNAVSPLDKQPDGPVEGEEVLASLLQWSERCGRRSGPIAGIVELNWTTNPGRAQSFAGEADDQHQLGSCLTVEQMAKIFDSLDKDGLSPEMIYFAGTEPAGHPQLGEFIELARARGTSQVGLQCDGPRIAQDDHLLSELSRLKPLLFIEFDGFDETASLILHGRRDLPYGAKRGLDRLAAMGLSAVLLASIARGVNLQEVGAIAAFGLKHPAVFSTIFRPISPRQNRFGASAASHVTATGIIDALEQQGGGLFSRDAFSPAFCCQPSRHFVARIPNVCREMISFSAPGRSTNPAGPETDLANNSHHPKRNPEPCFWLSVHEFMTPWSKDVRQAQRCPLVIMTADGRTIPYCLYHAEEQA